VMIGEKKMTTCVREWMIGIHREAVGMVTTDEGGTAAWIREIWTDQRRKEALTLGKCYCFSD